MRSAIKTIAVISGVWCLFIAVPVFLLMAFVNASYHAMGPQLIGGPMPWSEFDSYFGTCFLGFFIYLFLLIGAFRLRRWACLALTVTMILFFLIFAIYSTAENLYLLLLYPAICIGPGIVLIPLLCGFWRHLEDSF
jgi:hypothetical protein